jgi:hypothetical protein
MLSSIRDKILPASSITGACNALVRVTCIHLSYGPLALLGAALAMNQRRPAYERQCVPTELMLHFWLNYQLRQQWCPGSRRSSDASQVRWKKNSCAQGAFLKTLYWLLLSSIFAWCFLVGGGGSCSYGCCRI